MKPSDEQLLLTSSPDAADEAEAVGQFYARTERIILAYFVRRTGDPELAADLCAITYLRVFEKRSQFKGQAPGDAMAWLFAIAAHVLTHHWRRRKIESREMRRMFEALPTLTDKQAAEIDALTEDGPLMAALGRLDEPQREAVHAYVIGDESYEQIAQRASIAPAAARKRVSRGLAALRASRRDGRSSG